MAVVKEQDKDARPPRRERATDQEHLFDEKIGAKLRYRRTEIGMSQYALARGAMVSYQQIQKYEAAETRISASRLVVFAKALGVPPSYFLDDLDVRAPHRWELDILRVMEKMSEPKRKAVSDFIRSMVAT